MSYLLKFGSYTLPTGLYVASDNGGYVVPSAKLPRRSGSVMLAGTLDKKKITVQGGLSHSFLPTGSGGTVRSQLDSLQAGLAQGPTTFQVSDDRYLRNCQVENFSSSYEATGFDRLVNIRFDVLAGDPYWYEVAGQTATKSLSGSPASKTVTGGGNTPSQPVVAITVTSTGTIAASISNTTTGETFTLAGSVTNGDVITVDSLNETVTISGVDKMVLFDGVFPSLAVGSNAWTITYSGVTLSGMTWSWNNRWL